MPNKNNNKKPGVPTPEATLEKLGERQAETSLHPVLIKDRLYFAYDIMMDHTVVSRYTKGLVAFKVAKLVNHKLVWPWYHPPSETALPSVLRTNDPDDYVWGILYNANRADMGNLERYIRLGTRNYRKSVNVFDQGDRGYDAFTYAFTARSEEDLKPSPSYLEALVSAAREQGLPDDWIKRLASTDTA